MKKQYLELLLSINDAIATTQDWLKLVHVFFEKLKNAFNFQLAGIQLLNKSKTHLELFIKGYETFISEEYKFDIHEKVAIADTPFAISINNPVIRRIKMSEMLKKNSKIDNFDSLKNMINHYKIDSVVHSPLITGGNLIGFLVLAFDRDNKISNEELEFLRQISNQVAIFLSITIAYGEIIQREKIKEIQLAITNSLVNIKERDQLLKRIAVGIDNILSISYMGLNIKKRSLNESITISFVKEGSGNFKIYPVNKNRDIPFLTLKSHLTPESDKNFHEFTSEEFRRLCQQSTHFRYLSEKYGVEYILFIADTQSLDEEINLILAKDGKPRFIPLPVLKNPRQFIEREIEFIINLIPQLSLVIRNYFAYEEIHHLKKQLEQEKNYLLDEINLANNFQEIIGATNEIKIILNKIEQVAPIDVTVLIQGETGTGKELIARAIHNLSVRKDKSLIKVNCTALPAQLIESELFGHEKGSFTGAIEQRIGKFELANGGTIFLDEIGELPLELQAKLLRVLQEQEFERIGGKQTIKIDIRIIAATNRNLEQEVEKGNFRSDLFFRLNVFPLDLPPLRKRTDDIPLFVKHFTELYSKKVGKPIKTLRKADLELLKQYEWPGNIRELEHLIERAVIISNSQNLEISEIIPVRRTPQQVEIKNIKPLHELEREHIITALKAAKGKVTGENGAAKILGINGKTLGSKMRKFGIKREITITE
jgi:transcriptional regulator with GAF, ATPase, and Fis domain